jgi:hypothetical protein
MAAMVILTGWRFGVADPPRDDVRVRRISRHADLDRPNHSSDSMPLIRRALTVGCAEAAARPILIGSMR